MDRLTGIIEHVSFKDALDIFIVSLIIFKLLNSIRGTRSVQMTLGLGAGILMLIFGRMLDLQSLSWLMASFFENFILVFVILFQEQIRGVLSVVGGSTWWRPNRGKTASSESVEEIVECVMALQKEKIGALIVLEKSQGLMNFIETGTRLNCPIHSDLIYSIFLPSSPLHDGAIIITQNQIKAAGCFLPLSRNIEIHRHLGTRHRAALGLTEVSDAIVILVSEQTGQIKICFQELFYILSDEESLRRKLLKLLKDQDQEIPEVKVESA